MAKKKKVSKKPLTIVKILSKDGTISQEDLIRWRLIFRDKLMTTAEAVATGEVEVEFIPNSKVDENVITIVKIGNEDYKPSMKDLEDWRAVFAQAQDDPDFKIFCHEHVEIEVVKLGDIVTVE